MSKTFKALVQSYARTPVIGAGLVFLIVVLSIVLGTHSILALFSLEGLVIVVGGVIATAFMSFQPADVRKALDAIVRMFQEPPAAPDNLHRDMMGIVAWAILVKEKGMRNLEAHIGKAGIADPFVKYGLNMVVSEYSSDDVRGMMETAADACYERDSVPVDVLTAMASHAPAFGMIGTLVGMVIMLCSLSGDVSGIGSSLAVAFLSTLYGVLSARMIYMPAASRLRQEVENRRFRNHLVTEGMAMLVANKNPMYIQDHLNSFLRPEIHDYFDYFKSQPRPVEKFYNRATPPFLKAVGA